MQTSPKQKSVIVARDQPIKVHILHNHPQQPFRYRVEFAVPQYHPAARSYEVRLEELPKVRSVFEIAIKNQEKRLLSDRENTSGLPTP
jgi:hypothetical protein